MSKPTTTAAPGDDQNDANRFRDASKADDVQMPATFTNVDPGGTDSAGSHRVQVTPDHRMDVRVLPPPEVDFSRSHWRPTEYCDHAPLLDGASLRFAPDTDTLVVLFAGRMELAILRGAAAVEAKQHFARMLRAG